MKVLFIQPNSPGCSEQVAFTEPLGICLLAALLERRGISTKIVHQIYPQYISDDQILELATEYEPDCIGISTITENYLLGLNLSKKLKKVFEVPIVFGGNHVTSYPEVVGEPSIDLGVLGHAIDSFPDIVEQLVKEEGDWKKNPSVAYESDGTMHIGKPGEYTGDLDLLPFSKRDGLPLELYKIYPMLMLPPSRQRVLSMYTAWGCKYCCEFCLVPVLFEGKWAAQSSSRVLGELEAMKDRFDMNFVHFHDDDFCADVDRAAALCQGLIDRRLDVKFGMMTRADHLTRDLLDLMEEAGLMLLTLGIEGGTEDGLIKTKKGITQQMIRQQLDLTRNRGIQINTNYVVGFPWDSRETLEEAFRFILKLPLDSWGVNFFIPFKELEIRKTMDEEGLIDCVDFSKFSFKEAIVRTRFLSRQELEKITRKMIVRFYFRLSYLLWLVRRACRNPQMIRSIIEVFIWGVSRRSRFLLKN